MVKQSRTGVWFVGVRGSVATTAMAGATAVRLGLAAPVGLVSELPDFAQLPLAGFGELVFGGHDIVATPLAKRVEQLTTSGVVPRDIAAAVLPEVTAVEAEIRDGVHVEDAVPQLQVVERLAADIAGFRERHGLDRVVVINVSSTEPPSAYRPEHDDLAALTKAMETDAYVLPPSSVYAYAAFEAGCAFVDFTPSTGARLPALDELAKSRGVPYAGSDGKTGETLMRSALAPMFTTRALRVLSWSGTNLLGGGDGATLADPAAAASKTASKQRGMAKMLGYSAGGEVHIDYVPDLGDWKTAWDHILFEGFLGVRMTMQFTWQGCDSALAAPLVLDLARFTSWAHEQGESGALTSLGFFFKDPVGTDEHRLLAQYDALREWAVR
ncbi:myo-inositol-1-phosphate synthase [Herbidospora galbida]|uniref:Myo-inositol-1-phosphate synthase n=1 Tax=Herbidospora galbida TaxID=2575442 RepID=A0A4U3M6Y2_9ACTN|nr:inositol-3-phosphate synthase [Herbidospora galbida]TKK83724.1 myo-inositol-1-phosphate synthase [Herbidospora galbida]